VYEKTFEESVNYFCTSANDWQTIKEWAARQRDQLQKQ